MVERRIEDRLLHVVGARQLAAREEPVPLCARCGPRLVEAAFRLRGEVARGAVLVGRRHRDLRDDNAVRRAREVEDVAVGLLAGLLRQDAIRLPRLRELEPVGEAAGKPRLDVVVARKRAPVLAQAGFRLLHVRGDVVLRVVDVAVLEIHEDVRVAPFWERPPVVADALRRGQLDLYAEIRQRHRIVAGRGGLGREVLRPAEIVGKLGVAPGERLQKDVPQVCAARSAQVRLGEAVDVCVLMRVAGAVLPVVRPSVGAWLNQRTRACRAGERMAVVHPGRPYEGVYVHGRVVSGGRA